MFPVIDHPTPPKFVVNDNSLVLLGTIANKKNWLIPGEPALSGTRINVTIDWGDGTTSGGTLLRDAKHNIQVWTGHEYAQLKTYKIKVFTIGDQDHPHLAFQKSAPVQLNSQAGATLNLIAGSSFSGKVASVSTLVHSVAFGRTGAILTLWNNYSFGGSPPSSQPSISPPQIYPSTEISLHTGDRFAQFTYLTSGDTYYNIHAILRIDWGDGTVSNGFVNELDGVLVTDAKRTCDIKGTHTYAAPGSYRIRTYIIFADNFDLSSPSLMWAVQADTIECTATVSDSPATTPPARPKTIPKPVIPLNTPAPYSAVTPENFVAPIGNRIFAS